MGFSGFVILIKALKKQFNMKIRLLKLYLIASIIWTKKMMMLLLLRRQIEKFLERWFLINLKLRNIWDQIIAYVVISRHIIAVTENSLLLCALKWKKKKSNIRLAALAAVEGVLRHVCTTACLCIYLVLNWNKTEAEGLPVNGHCRQAIFQSHKVLWKLLYSYCK